MVLAGLARRGGRRVTPLSLAACSGVLDLVAFAGLGGAFASIVTGNLVVVGLGIGEADNHVFATSAVAVAGYSAGVAWAQATRRWQWPAHLMVEIALVGALAGGWAATDSRPDRTTSLLLLATAGVAMGTQSVVAHRMHESTTYLTGTLTGALHDLVAGQGGRRTAALGQLAALTAGAAVAAVLFQTARWSVPLLAIGLLLVALLAVRGPR